MEAQGQNPSPRTQSQQMKLKKTTIRRHSEDLYLVTVEKHDEEPEYHLANRQQLRDFYRHNHQ